MMWSNDVFNGTDEYYTNGLKMTVFHPSLAKDPFHKLIPVLPRKLHRLYGMSLSQDIYTPSDVDTLGYLPDDRPYAGNLMLYMTRQSYIEEKRMRLNGALGFGFIGQIALGGATQNGIHAIINNNQYGGWYNQLGNRLLMNYSMILEKGLQSDKYSQFIVVGTTELGNLRTNVGIGYLWRVGILAPYFTPYVYKKGDKKFYFSFYLDAKVKFIAYDATLNSSYQSGSAPSYQLDRLVGQGKIGLNVMYARLNFLIVQNMITAEFNTGNSHKYVSIELGYRFK